VAICLEVADWNEARFDRMNFVGLETERGEARFPRKNLWKKKQRWRAEARRYIGGRDGRRAGRGELRSAWTQKRARPSFRVMID